MISPTSWMKNKGDTGFTLIELLLVVMMIGVLAAVLFPRLQGSSRAAALRAALEALGEVTRMARLESVAFDRKTRLRWTEKGDVYWVEIQKGDSLETGGFERSGDRWLGRSRTLPMGVRISGVQYGAEGNGDRPPMASAHTASEVAFTPDGMGPAMTIVLRDVDDRPCGITLGAWYEDVGVLYPGTSPKWPEASK